MALSGTNRGTGGNATAATTINISPASNFTSGSYLILAIAYDNAGNAGSDNYSSVTFPSGIVTSNFNILNDPGNANAGSVLRVHYSTQPINSFTTSDVVTITFAANVTAKAWTLTEILTDVPGATYRFVTFRTGQGNGTTQTIDTSGFSQNIGDLFYAVLGQEGNGTRTADSDTTDGSWSTAQSTGFGTTTAGQEIISQFKVTTGTSVQTYNPSATTVGDWNMAIIQWREIPPYEPFDPMGMMGFFGI